MGTRAIAIKGAQLKRRKGRLESKLRELLAGFHERENLRIEYLADPLDRVRSNADREVAVQRLDHQARWIHDIQSAVAKMKEGSYGVCERCEGRIALKRLDTVPWARLCLRCQSTAEDTGGRKAFQHAA